MTLPELPLAPADLARGLAAMDPDEARVAAALLTQDVCELPAPQRAIVEVLLDHPTYGPAPSYPAVAQALEVSVGTVHRTLQRLRRRHPALYRQITGVRLWQLAQRHAAAAARARETKRRLRREQAEDRWTAARVGVTRKPWEG